MGDSVTQLQGMLLEQARHFRNAVGVLHTSFEARLAPPPPAGAPGDGDGQPQAPPPPEDPAALVENFSQVIGRTASNLDKLIGHLPRVEGTEGQQKRDAAALVALSVEQTHHLVAAVERGEALLARVRHALEAISSARFAAEDASEATPDGGAPVAGQDGIKASSNPKDAAPEAMDGVIEEGRPEESVEAEDKVCCGPCSVLRAHAVSACPLPDRCRPLRRPHVRPTRPQSQDPAVSATDAGPQSARK